MSVLRFHRVGCWRTVELRRVASTRRSTPEIDDAIETAWRSVLARPGVKLFDGPMSRLEAWHDDGDAMRLDLSPTSYKTFVGTNLFNPTFADTYGREVMANPVGVSPALLTGDGQLLMGRRNGSVVYYPHRVHPFAGSLEPAATSAFDDVRRELFEELSLTRDDVPEVMLTGISEDVSIRQPELIFAAKTPMSRDVVLSRLHPDEHDGAWSCEATADAIARALRSDERFTPVAIAAMLLWGRVAFGNAWFDEHSTSFLA